MRIKMLTHALGENSCEIYMYVVATPRGSYNSYMYMYMCTCTDPYRRNSTIKISTCT